MQIDVSAHNTKLSQPIVDTVKEKFKRFERHIKDNKKELKIHVVLHHENELFRADANVRGLGEPLFATVKNHDMYVAINELSKLIDKQYSKRKHD